MTSPSQTALEGVKVLDLSRVLAGPWCTQILADFGADVIKIEAPGQGDDTRGWGPPNLPPLDGVAGDSAYYITCNRNKRSIAVDLKTPEGQALIHKLARKADIVVENFKVGSLAKFGLDHASLKKDNPKLVYCSITGFGQDGPYASRPGYDFVAQAMGGLMSITGEKDGPALKAGIPIADLTSGMYATVSVLLALRHAERTGEGQHIDVSLLESQIAMLANQASSYLVTGKSPQRIGNAHQTVVPYRVFDTADGAMVIAVGNDRQFHSLCGVLDAQNLSDDPRFQTNNGRADNRDVLEPALANLISKRHAVELSDALSEAKVPCGPVNSVGDVLNDPFCEAREVVHNFKRSDGVDIPSIRFPAHFSVTPAQFNAPPPALGEQSRSALQDWLNLEEADLDGLEAAGAIVQGGGAS